MTPKPINESTLLFVIKLLKADVLDGKTVTRAGISTMPAKAENSVRTIIIPILDRMYFKNFIGSIITSILLFCFVKSLCFISHLTQ
ncbi:hypothetical protein DWY44_10980 [Ruminococcus sp. AF25-19]|nr:hypothetical protein DWY44_10980 [Ruminococcus sp. AF25-19]